MPFLEEWRAEPKLAMNALKQLSSWPMAVVQMIEMIKAVRVQVDHFHCGVAINACQTRWRTAMYVLSLMHSWTVRLASSSFNACAVAIRKSRHWNSALCSAWLTDDARSCGVQSDVVGFNIGLSSKTWSKGIALLGTMRMQQVRLDEFGSSSLMAQASWRVALQFRESVRAAQVQQSLVTQNAALHACSESWLRAMQLLQIALKHQHRLSCTSFGSVLKTCAAGAWPVASRLIHVMTQSAMQPNQICLTSASTFKDPAVWQSALQMIECLDEPEWVTSQALCGCWQVALELAKSESMLVGVSASLSRVSLWSLSLQLPFFRFEPSVVHCNTAIAAHQAAHQWQLSMHVLSGCTRSNVRPDETSFNGPLGTDGQCWQRGMVLLQQMGQLQLEADRVSWNTLLSTSKNTWTAAVKLLGHMPISSLQADLFSVSSCLQNLRWEMAFGLTPLVTLDLLSCNLLLGTVNAVNANRDVWPTWPLSLRVLREMALWQVQADGVSYLSSIQACSTSGLWEVASSLLCEMELRRLSSHIARSAVIGACAEAGQWQFALLLLRTMETSKVADPVSYSECIDACAKAERQRCSLGAPVQKASPSCWTSGGSCHWSLRERRSLAACSVLLRGHEGFQG